MVINNKTKKKKTFLILNLIPTFLLTSCFSNLSYLTYEIPTSVKNLELKENKTTNVEKDTIFKPSEILNDNRLVYKENSKTSLLVLEGQFSDSKKDLYEPQRLDTAFNDLYSYVSVNKYFKETSNGKLVFEVNGLEDFVAMKKDNQTLSAKEFLKSVEKDGKLNYLPILLTYLTLYNYQKQYNVSIETLNKYDSNNDGLLDSIYILPNINHFEKGLILSDEIKTALSSSTYIYSDKEAYEIKSICEEYLNLKFNFTVSSFSFSSSKYMTEVNDLYMIDYSPYYVCYNHQYIYEVCKLLGLTSLKSSKNVPLGYTSMMSGTVGDLDPFSKLLLNFVDPVIVNTESKYYIEKPSKDTVYLITNTENLNKFSVFSEYLLIGFYDYNFEPNNRDVMTFNEHKLLNRSGFNVYSVDSRLQYLSDNVYHKVDLNKDSYNKDYTYEFIKNQTRTTNLPLIKLYDSNGDDSIYKDKKLTKYDLFVNQTAFNYGKTFNSFKFDEKKENFNFSIFFEELHPNNNIDTISDFNIYIKDKISI